MRIVVVSPTIIRQVAVSLSPGIKIIKVAGFVPPVAVLASVETQGHVLCRGNVIALAL